MILRSVAKRAIGAIFATTAAALSVGTAAADEWQTSVTRNGNVERVAAPQKLTGRSHALAGAASYYWQGQMTASGEQFNKRELTAAHRTLPFGTRVRVTRADTGASVVVRINDRGPFTKGRVIDLSERAAESLHMKGLGTAPVKLEVVGR